MADCWAPSNENSPARSRTTSEMIGRSSAFPLRWKMTEEEEEEEVDDRYLCASILEEDLEEEEEVKKKCGFFSGGGGGGGGGIRGGEGCRDAEAIAGV